MTDLRELAEHVEAARTDEQRDMLEAAFSAIHGEKPPRVHGGSQELTDWLNLHNPFVRMLDAEAYDSAARSLVPEGWHVGMLTECDEDDFPAACLTENEEPCRDAVGKGVNMTLSLVAAALRAREEDRG